MKKKHVYVMIVFIILAILITGIWKLVIQINLNKYILTDEKISKYQDELKDMLVNPTDELVNDMTDSYKIAAQKEYDDRVNNQMSTINIILISLGLSAFSCAIIEGVVYLVDKKNSAKPAR